MKEKAIAVVQVEPSDAMKTLMDAVNVLTEEVENLRADAMGWMDTAIRLNRKNNILESRIRRDDRSFAKQKLS